MHITYILPHNKIQTQCGAVMSFLHYYLKKAGWVVVVGACICTGVQTCMYMSE